MSASGVLAAGAVRAVAKPVLVRAPRVAQASLPIGPRPGFRVLQTSRAPAQLSLFLLPGVGRR